jgi:ABC-type multidrug transport system fused ATPase/permease subunit
LVFQIASAVVGRLRDSISTIHQDVINNAIDLEMIEKINALDISFFDNPKFYDEMLRASNDSQALQTMTWVAVRLISNVIQTIACAALLCRINLLIPILLLLLNIPSMLIDRYFIKKNYNWQRSRATHQRKMNYYKENLKSKYSAKDVRVFNLGDYFYNNYIKLWKQWLKEKKQIMYQRSVFSSIMISVPQIGVTGVLVYIGIRILQGGLTIGDFTFYSQMSNQFTTGVAGIFSSITSIYENELKLENYKKFLKWETKLSGGGGLAASDTVEIEFRNVSFTYPGTSRHILKDVSFKIKPYEKVALVGVNGAGKSTIIKLILRLYDPTSGGVYVNGINTKEYDIKALQKIFGVVFQDYVNYAFTIKESITLSDISNFDDIERIQESCKAAGIENIIKRFPNGLDTYLTKQFDENGEELSGGEWQKLALARAYFRESVFMIMDEPTAALDPEAEYRIFQTLTDMCRDKGAVFISHRLSSVTMADRIFVLENGRIIESGSHKDLLSQNGRYAYLFNLQAERYADK